jgi:hypothetical protein
MAGITFLSLAVGQILLRTGYNDDMPPFYLILSYYSLTPFDLSFDCLYVCMVTTDVFYYILKM